MGVFTGGRWGTSELLVPRVRTKFDDDYDFPFKCTISTCKERFHHKKDLKAHKESKHVY